MNDARQVPLVADPLRQAVDPARGYYAQIVRSVWQWMNLQDDQVLYLEGAEDWDKVGPDGVVEAVQAKETVARVTLGARSVVTTLLNYWDHCKRNEDRSITLRFLTTSERGKERGGPFGDELGLDHWERCGSDASVPLDTLRSYLVVRIEAIGSSDQVAKDLVAFLLTADDAGVRSQLLGRIIWDTAAPGYESVLKQIADQVILDLDRLGMPASEAERVAPRLVDHAYRIAVGREERRLDRVDYLRALEDAATVRIPRGRLKELESGFGGGEILPTMPDSDWYREIPQRLYEEARRMSSEGALSEAEVELGKLLTHVRAVPENADPLRVDFEQSVLLSLAQIAFRKANRPTTRALLLETQALGPITGGNRHLAGWVLLNLGENEDAVALLDPSDGSERWDRTLAIALVSAGKRDEAEPLIAAALKDADGDVLLALLRQARVENDMQAVADLAVQVIDADDGSPLGRYRAIEATWTVVYELIVADEQPELETSVWLERCRALLSDSAKRLEAAVPLNRIIALRRQIEFHQALMELDLARDAFSQLVALGPDFAAELAATSGLLVAGEADILTMLAAASDPVDALIVEVLYQHTDPRAAAEKLASVAVEVTDSRAELIRALRIESLSDAGEPLSALESEIELINDPVTRAVLKGAVLAKSGDVEESERVLDAALERLPTSQRLLRAAFAQSTESRQASEGTDVQWDRVVELGERLVHRLPCPEFRLALARVRQESGDLELALATAREVEEEGFRPARSAALVADIALELRRVGDYADAARRVFSAEKSVRAGLFAASAAMRARRYSDAEVLYRELIRTEDRDAMLRAYAGLAEAVEAQVGPSPEGREAGARVLLEAYDSLGAPEELGAALYFRALGTPLAKEVHDRIGSDFSNLEDLPGIVSMPVEEGLEMIRRDQEGAKLRADLLLAGALPFDTAIELGHRNAFYVWAATRIGRVARMLAPPRLKVDEAIAPIAPELRVLVDRTALMTVAELGLLDPVIEAGLHLVLSQEDFDWLEREEAEMRLRVRPASLRSLQALTATLDAEDRLPVVEEDVAAGLLQALQETLPWGDALDLAQAIRHDLVLVSDFIDLEAVPQEHSERVVRSSDVLRTCLGAAEISVSEASTAMEQRPSSFDEAGIDKLEVGASILLAPDALDAWHEVGLLDHLAGAFRTSVASRARWHAQANYNERRAESDGLESVTELRVALLHAIDAGQASVVPSASVDHSQEDQQSDALQRIAAPLVSRMRLAARAKTPLWSDDAAVHCYLDARGPMLDGVPELHGLAGTLSVQFAGVDAYNTGEVLKWLVSVGALTRDQYFAALRELTTGGRLLFTDAEALLAEARQPAQSRDCYFRVFPSLPAILSPAIGRRCGAEIVSCAGSAMVLAWTSDDPGRGDVTEALVELVAPWVLPEVPFGRFCADVFWGLIVRDILLQSTEDADELLRTVLERMTKEPKEFGRVLRALWHAVELIDGLLAQGTAEGIEGILHLVFAQIAVASAGVTVDGEAVLSPEMIRLQSRAFGLRDLLGIENHWEGSKESDTYRFVLSEGQVERLAAEEFNQIAAGWDESEPILAATVYRIEMNALSECGSVTAPYKERVELLRILDLLSPEARTLAAKSLAAAYADSEPELASAVQDFLVALDGDVDIAQAHATLIRSFLKSPRLWVEHDLGQAFRLLHEAPLAALRVMAGSPTAWQKGEHYGEYLVRAIGGMEDQAEQIRTLDMVRGPNDLALQSGLAQIDLRTPETPTPEYVRDLSAQVAFSVDAYSRAASYAQLRAVLRGHPDLGDTTLDELSLDESILGIEPIVLDRTVSEFADEILASWIRAELDPDSPGAEGPLEHLVIQHGIWDGLLVATTRYSSRAVLNQRHSDEIHVESASDSDRDQVGDLLLIAEGVSQAMHAALAPLAIRDGVASVHRELELLHQQEPLSQPRVPIGEAMVPEALDASGQGVNPFIALVLGFLRKLVSADADPEPSPQWFSSEVLALLTQLSVRTPHAGVRELAALSASGEIQDRFGSLLPAGVEGAAAALLQLLEGEPEQPSL